jgi:hypothetical protein
MIKGIQAKKTVLLFLFAGLLIFPGMRSFSQGEAKSFELELQQWRFRIDHLTEGLEKDSALIDSTERSLYLVHLAGMYEDYETSRSSEFLQRGASLLVAGFSSDEGQINKEKLDLTVKVIQMIFRLNEQLGLGVSEKLFEKIKSNSTTSKAKADLLVSLGIQVSKSDARLAHDLGLSSLGFGYGARFNQLISELAQRDPELAESAYQAGLFAAYRGFDYTFIGGLGVAFGSTRGQELSENARRGYFVLLSTLLRDAVTYPERQPQFCGVAALASPLLPRFQLDYPAEAALMHQNIRLCIPFLPESTRGVFERQTDESEPKTVEDLVTAARESKDNVLKARYYYLAQGLLERAKAFEKAISLLDNMSNDEREAVGLTAWDGWRGEHTIQHCLALYRSNDIATLHRTIDRTPIRLRPLVRTSLVYGLKGKAEPEFLLEQLESVRKEADTKNMEARNAASSFLALIPAYLDLNPGELPGLFRETIKMINAADQENPNRLPEKDFAPLRDVIKLPSYLLETDQIGTMNAIQDIRQVPNRNRVRLGLIQSAIDHITKLALDRNADSHSPE